MKKKIILAVVLILVLALAALLIVNAFVGGKTIGKDAALQAALADAGLTRDQVVDVDIELERERGSSWYEVDFEYGHAEYEYKINAYSGEILFSRIDN